VKKTPKTSFGEKIGKMKLQQTTKTLPNRFASRKKDSPTRKYPRPDSSPESIRAPRFPQETPSRELNRRREVLRGKGRGGTATAGGRGDDYCREEKSAVAVAAVAGKKRRQRWHAAPTVNWSSLAGPSKA
jgi:hypothetical protein